MSPGLSRCRRRLLLHSVLAAAPSAAHSTSCKPPEPGVSQPAPHHPACRVAARTPARPPALAALLPQPLSRRDSKLQTPVSAPTHSKHCNAATTCSSSISFCNAALAVLFPVYLLIIYNFLNARYCLVCKRHYLPPLI